MSDSNQSCNISNGTTAELATKNKIKAKCLISPSKSESLKSSFLSVDAFDLNEFNRDIRYLLSLTNNLQCKIEKFLILPPTTNEKDDFVNAIRGINQSYESIRCFIKEDNINVSSLPEFQELSIKVKLLQEYTNKNHIGSSIKNTISKQSTISHICVEDTAPQTPYGVGKCCFEKSFNEVDSVLNSCNIKVLNEVSENSDNNQSDKILERAEINTPLIEKFENSIQSNSHFNKSEQEEYQFSPKLNSANASQNSDISIEIVGTCIFIFLLACVVLLYIVSKLI